jgi:hypothetical protein
MRRSVYVAAAVTVVALTGCSAATPTSSASDQPSKRTTVSAVGDTTASNAAGAPTSQAPASQLTPGVYVVLCSTEQTSDGFPTGVHVHVVSATGATAVDRTFPARGDMQAATCSPTVFNDDFTRVAGYHVDLKAANFTVGSIDSSGNFTALPGSTTSVGQRASASFAPTTNSEWWAKSPLDGPTIIGRDNSIITSQLQFSSDYSFDFIFPMGGDVPLVQSGSTVHSLSTGASLFSNQFRSIVDPELRCQSHSKELVGTPLSAPDNGPLPTNLVVSGDCSTLAYVDSNTLWLASTAQRNPYSPTRVASVPAGMDITEFKIVQ